jgi:chorismate mutase
VGPRIGTLQKDGLLSESEAGLLKSELSGIVEGVEAKRAVDQRMATCYEPGMIRPAHDSLKRLQERLPLLEKLAAAKSVNPEVVAKVLCTVEDDLAILSRPKLVEDLKPPERSDAPKVRNAAQAALTKIQAVARGIDTSLAKSAAWKTVTDGMAAVAPLAESGKSTERQRQVVEGQLDAAAVAADKLVAEGLLTWAEGEFLKAEMQKLRSEMLRDPPTDTSIQCYQQMVLLPAQQSMDRLTDRLPLLQKMIAQGRISPEVLARALPTVEADLKTLSDEKALGQLDKDRQVEVRSSLVPRVQEVLKQLRTLEKERTGPGCYKVMPVQPRASAGPAEQAARLALLEKMVAAGKVAPDVLAAVCRQMEDAGRHG